MSSMSHARAATVKLHRALYTQRAIQDAAATFADFGAFAVRRDGDHYIVDITNISSDVEGDVVAEFCNFALANTVTSRKERSS